MTPPVKRQLSDTNIWNPFDEIRRMQEYMEQILSSLSMLDNQFGSELSSPLTDISEEETNKEGYVMREQTLMRFSREILLMSYVTKEGATAQLNNGVLTVTLPKVKQMAEKRITIDQWKKCSSDFRP